MRKGMDQYVRWSKRERSLLYGYSGDKPTSMLIAHFLEAITMGDAYGNGRIARAPQPGDGFTLAQELDARGYDLTTLRFSIRKKA